MATTTTTTTTNGSEWLTAGEAAALLGVSKMKMAQLIRVGVLPAEQGTLDRRVKLVRRADVERLAGESRGKGTRPFRREK